MVVVDINSAYEKFIALDLEGLVVDSSSVACIQNQVQLFAMPLSLFLFLHPIRRAAEPALKEWQKKQVLEIARCTEVA